MSPRLDTKKILNLFAATGMTAKEFCKKSGLAFMTFQRILAGERVHLLSITKLALALNVDPGELLKE